MNMIVNMTALITGLISLVWFTVCIVNMEYVLAYFGALWFWGAIQALNIMITEERKENG